MYTFMSTLPGTGLCWWRGQKTCQSPQRIHTFVQLYNKIRLYCADFRRPRVRAFVSPKACEKIGISKVFAAVTQWAASPDGISSQIL